MNIKSLLSTLGFLLIGIHVTIAQEQNEVDLKKEPTFKSLKKALRSKRPVYKLDLTNQGLTAFPERLTELKQLQILILDSNEITEIPPSIQEYKDLLVFSIAYNKLTTVPSELGQLNELVYLYLDHNQIHSFSDQPFYLDNIYKLHLENNNLTAIPDEILNMNSLGTLSLYENNIKEIPKTIEKLYNLESFSISNNPIHSLPDGFFKLINLRQLFLFGTQMTSIPPEINALKQLNYLVVSESPITEIPDSFYELYNLEYVYFAQTKITNVSNKISLLFKLKKLSLYDTPIVDIPTQLENLDSLEVLFLGKNKFEKIPQVLYDLNNRGVEIDGFEQDPFFEIRLLQSKANNKILIQKYDEAVVLLDSLLNIDTNNIQALSSLAQAQMELGEFHNAQKTTRRAFSKKLNDKYAEELEAIYLQSKLSKNKATELEADIISKHNSDSNDITALIELGKYYTSRKNYNKALTYYQKAIQQQPLSAEGHYYLSLWALKQDLMRPFALSFIRSVTLENSSKKVKTTLPFLLQHFNMKIGIDKGNGSTYYNDSFVILDDENNVLHRNQNGTANLLQAMLSDLSITLEVSDSTKLNNRKGKNNVEIFEKELRDLISNDTLATNETLPFFESTYLPFYQKLEVEKQLEALSYFINNSRNKQDQFVIDWMGKHLEEINRLKKSIQTVPKLQLTE